MNTSWEQIKLWFVRIFSRGQLGMESTREYLDRQSRVQLLKNQVRTLARERQSLVMTIGRKVYALHSRGKVKNRDVLSDCLRLDQNRGEIEDLKRKIEEIRLASLGEMAPVDLEDDSFLGEDEPAGEAQSAVESAEQDEELAPPEADGPAPEPEESGPSSAPEVDEEEGAEDGAEEPAGV
jgi:hypothetical protein